jgi:glycosidase
MKGHRRLLEINTVLWLSELSENYGESFSLADVPDEELDRFRKTGFDYIWFMGVWKRSRRGFEIFRQSRDFDAFRPILDATLPGWTEDDLIGSPYSIASYEPDPLVGTWDDLKRLRERLHERNMGLVLDFVPNHTGPDFPWVSQNPEFYILVDEREYIRNPSNYTVIEKDENRWYFARGRDPYFPPWTDTLQLNHFNPHMRRALVEELKKISTYCDGVRCDMAMLVLNDIFQNVWGWAKENNVYEEQKEEFWTVVRASVPELILIAEAYWDTERRLQQMGFDYVYDKGLYDRLRYASCTDLIMYLKADVSYQERLLRFIENHDEERAASVFPKDRLMASAILFSTLPGMKLYHHGQLEGRKTKVPLQLRRAKREEPDQEMFSFYKRLLELTSVRVFFSGRWELLEVPSDSDIISYVWSIEDEMIVVVVNFSPHPSSGRVYLKGLNEQRQFFLKELWQEAETVITGLKLQTEGIHIELKGYEWRIFYLVGSN